MKRWPIAALGIALGLLSWRAEAQVLCASHAFYDASTNGSTKIITGAAGKDVLICGVMVNVGSTATNVKLVEGTGTNCGSGTASMTPAYQIAANGNAGFLTWVWTGLKTATAGDDVCINASAGNAVQADVWYAIQ